LSLVNVLGPCQVCISRTHHDFVYSSFCTICRCSDISSFVKKMMSILLILPYNGNLVNRKKFYEGQSQIYLTTDVQSASLSWCQASIWDPGPDSFFFHGNSLKTDAVLFYYGTPYLTIGQVYTFQCSHSSVAFGNQIPVFMSSKGRVARLYPRPLGSLFIATSDS
jgi:hypothetical protein